MTNILAENRKARFDYEILEKLEAGIELLGFEVKSLKGGRGSLEGAHIIASGGEAFLIGATISPYQPGNTPKDYDPARTRRLLLTKKEIGEIAGAGKGFAIVPLNFHLKNGKIKLDIAVARGKKKYDKREVIKKRETERESRREMKYNY